MRIIRFFETDNSKSVDFSHTDATFLGHLIAKKIQFTLVPHELCVM